MDENVCRKCWWKVEMFHEFYMHIENIHNSAYQHESIFVANINDDLKATMLLGEKEEKSSNFDDRLDNVPELENSIEGVSKVKSKEFDVKPRLEKYTKKSSKARGDCKITNAASIFE